MNGDDESRPISAEGRALEERLAKNLKKRGYFPDAILHSPVTRTRETADVLGSFFKISIAECPNLSLWGNDEALVPLITPEKTTFMVGHGPTLALFAAKLAGGPHPYYNLATCSALILKFENDVALGEAMIVEYLLPEA
jgi:phosphohistidine phosphatase